LVNSQDDQLHRTPGQDAERELRQVKLLALMLIVLPSFTKSSYVG